MYAFVRHPHLFDSYSFRWIGRASAVILFVTWLALVITEAVRSYFDAPSVGSMYQAAAFAIVFAGYAVGWRHELAGGVLAILGTLIFFAAHAVTIGGLPGLAAAWFAAPGVFYLLAWSIEKSSGAPLARRP